MSQQLQTLDPAWLEYSDQRQAVVAGSCSIGRSASNHVALASDKVSRRHAAIQVQQGNEFWLVDFGSRNGTYVNGLRIVQPTKLRDGDRIRIGSHELVFHLPVSHQPSVAESVVTDTTIADIRQVRCWLLVADIIDSTRMIKELPPEEVPKLAGRWVAACRRALEGHGGRINQFMGDGFFAYWRDQQSPAAMVQSGLSELRQLQDEALPSFRMVVHYGEVVVGGVSVGEEERISGREVHFAFRLEKLAGSLGVPRLLSHACWERLGRISSARELGLYSLPGFEEKVPVYAF
jgi:adenylate cyclase